MNPIYFCNTHFWSSVNTKKQMASNCNLLCLWNVLSFRPISLINLIFSLHLFSPNNQFLTVGFTRLITEINWLAINILLILRACLKAHNTVCNACRDNRDTETVSLFIFIQTTSEFLFTRIPHFSKKKKKKKKERKWQFCHCLLTLRSFQTWMLIIFLWITKVGLKKKKNCYIGLAIKPHFIHGLLKK